MSIRKKYGWLIVALGMGYTSMAQAQGDSSYRLLRKINLPVSSFTVDNIGELYIVTAGNQLKKFNDKGDSIGVFNLVTQYGQLAYVEAQNPWKTILYYQNFSTIVLLDRYLNVLTAIDLRKLNIFKVHAVTTSYDNNIWLFDQQDSKLKKMDDNGRILSETVDLRLLFDSVPDPQKIIDRDGYVYLYDKRKGIYVFDYYGSFKNKLTFPGWTGMEVIGKTIYGFDAGHLYKYVPPLPDLTTYRLPEALEGSRSVRLGNHKIYILKDQELSVYYLP
jgi:hypothetical protein